MRTGGEYDYLNARVRGMSSRLLKRELLEQILQTDDEQIIVDVLLDSPYAEELSEALSHLHGVAAIEDALQRNLAATISRVRLYAPQGPKTLIDIQLGRWDIENVMTVLRGVQRRVSPPEITRSFVPVGSFSPVKLEILSREPDLRSVADSLTTWGSELAGVIRRTIGNKQQQVDLAGLEAKLYEAYFFWALTNLDPSSDNDTILRTLLKLQIDLLNLMGVLKEINFETRGHGAPEVSRIPGGSITPALIREIRSAHTVERALEILERTAFAQAVERGILAFGESNRLSVLERFLELEVIRRGMELFRRNPLSAAVPLGFIWRKINEFLNLRLLVRGKRYRLPASAIREEMLLV